MELVDDDGFSDVTEVRITQWFGADSTSSTTANPGDHMSRSRCGWLSDDVRSWLFE